MRSIFYTELNQVQNGQQIVLSDDRAKHLIKSVRINIGENVLLLDGIGGRATASVCHVTKHEIVFTITQITQNLSDSTIDLAICCCKKEAMEEIIRNAVELGIGKIYPIESQYAQRDFEWNARLDRIAESALIQSNNLFFPQQMSALGWKDFLNLVSSYQQVFYFSSQQRGGKTASLRGRCLMIIGPEGGLSTDEEQGLIDIPTVQLVQLLTPIMRAPTALTAAVGWLKALGF